LRPLLRIDCSAYALPEAGYAGRNFLLWEAAYAELWFTPVLWPDFDREHLYEAIRDFQKRSRRSGALEED
jgi:anaerobic selenocysteine-containing dehydrogenase